MSTTPVAYVEGERPDKYEHDRNRGRDRQCRDGRASRDVVESGSARTCERSSDHGRDSLAWLGSRCPAPVKSSLSDSRNSMNSTAEVGLCAPSCDARRTPSPFRCEFVNLRANPLI